MALIKINHNPPNRELRQFCGIWLPAGALIIGFSFMSDWQSRLILWGVLGAVAVIGLALPKLIRPIYVGLMYAVFPIGFVLSYVILAIVYYLVITPVGLIMRLVGYDPMQRTLQREAASYWMPREQVTNTSQYFRQF